MIYLYILLVTLCIYIIKAISIKIYEFVIKRNNKVGGDEMIANLFNLVTIQRYTCNPENKKARQVHARYRNEVLELLELSGLDADGNSIITEEDK